MKTTIVICLTLLMQPMPSQQPDEAAATRLASYTRSLETVVGMPVAEYRQHRLHLLDDILRSHASSLRTRLLTREEIIASVATLRRVEIEKLEVILNPWHHQ